MKKRMYHVGLLVILCVVVSIGYFVTPLVAFATTVVTDPNAIMNGAVWTKANSPYVLETDLYVSKGHILDIGPGVEVVSGTSTDIEKKWLTMDSDLAIRGTEDEPVSFVGFGGISVSNATVTVSHANFDLSAGMRLLKVHAVFDHPIFKGLMNTTAALSLRGSTVEIVGADFEGSRSAIWSYYLPTGPFLSKSATLQNPIGGIGNALAEIDPTQNKIHISESIIADNQKFAIYNETANTIDARSNWWGTSTESTGPFVTTSRSAVGNAVYGPVDVSDWKTERPALSAKTLPICCSNTLFLPGIEASRLYLDTLPVSSMSATSTNQLWEPNRNDDVRRLFLDDNGVSKNPAVYTKDIIDGGLGYKIYSSFISMMNGMVADGKIQKWLPFPYDWRKSVDDVVMSTHLVDQALALASSSPTGKINIVAHSNGGLLTKMLGRRLEEIGKVDIIDRVIFVAVPQWGTPQAIAGLLHGDAQTLGKGLVLSQGVARTFGLNMPGAYGLLPSEEFFRNIVEPVVSVGVSTGTSTGTATSSSKITSHSALADFLTGVTGGRSQPSQSDTRSASVLSTGFLNWAKQVHTLIDTWHFPTSTKVFSIAGWRLPTTETVNYVNGVMNKSLTEFGDGTVLTGVANGYGSNNLYFDQMSAGKKGIVTHADILEAKSVRETISSLIATTSTSVSVPALPSPLPSGISDSLPLHILDSWVTMSIHSPVDIDVYDTEGGHIGIVPNPDSTSDLTMLDNTIPGAIYDAIGEDKYVTVPMDATTTYSVKLRGTGSGNFTFKIDQTFADKPAISVTYADLPVTPLLLATTTVASLIDIAHATVTMSTTTPGAVTIDVASTTPPTLNLDVDGNGVSDVGVRPNPTIDPLVHLDSMRTIVFSLNLRKLVEKDILNRIDRIRQLVIKGKLDKAQVYIARATQLLKKNKQIYKKHWPVKKISDTDKQELLTLFENLLTALEQAQK